MIREIRGPERDGLERDQTEKKQGREKRRGILAQTGQVERRGPGSGGRGGGGARAVAWERSGLPAGRRGPCPAQPPLPGLQPCCSHGVCLLPPPPHPLLHRAPRRGGGWESAVLAWSQAPLRKGSTVIARGWGPSGRGWVQPACSSTFQRGELPTPGRPSFSQSVNTHRGTRSGPGLGRAEQSGRLDLGPRSLDGGRQEPMGPTLQIAILELLVPTTNRTKCLSTKL